MTIVSGHKGWEDAEIHDSRKMSTLILKYTREHHMGKYSLVAHNQLGSAECTCDLIVRKKQFPPVFWQRLYNVNGEGSRRFVGEIEVGGWPVPEVYWYKVMEDGEEVEVTTKTHTENWNGNPNKYVPDSRIEVRQIDQIRHVIIFHQVSEGDGGLYRVRAVNALGEAECEAELSFDGCGGGGDDLYLPPLWRERKRMTWKDEDQRKKPFVNFNEPALTQEELAEMRKKSGGVPLNRIMEYLASLPDYHPTDKFRHMDKIPFKPGVDERDYRPDRKGGKSSYPSVFQKGNIQHHGYKSDISGRILPVWKNKADPRSRDSFDFNWKPVHPDLYVPDVPPRCKSPPAPPVWELDEDIKRLVDYLNSMGCRVPFVPVIQNMKSSSTKQIQNQPKQLVKQDQTYTNTVFEAKQKTNQYSKQNSKIEKFSYIMPNEKQEEHSKDNHSVNKSKSQQSMWEERLNANVVGVQTNATEFTSHFMSQMYEKKDNLSFPELEQMGQGRPALPPKTKIMNSPSRTIFSPTESIESNGIGTASVKTVEFLPVKEKVKLIAAQQEELCRKEEASGSSGTEKKHKGVRILPPSPVTVRKMSVEDELYQYDQVVTRSTPVTQVMEKMQNKPLSPVMFNQSSIKSKHFSDTDYSTLDSGLSRSVSNYETNKESRQAHYSSQTVIHQQETRQDSMQSILVPGWSNNIDNSNTIKQEYLTKFAADKEIDIALDQLIADTESMVSNDSMFTAETSVQQYQTYTSTSESQTMSTNRMQSQAQTSTQQAVQSKNMYESSAEECRRSFEEAELEAMALESETSQSFSKQSSIVESSSNKSFVMQQQSSSNSTELESTFRSRMPVKSKSFIRTPDSFAPTVSATSAPNTPMSQRRRLQINQSPKPKDPDSKTKYREGPNAPFQPGFYRPPPEDPEKSHVFQLRRRSSSRSRASENSPQESISNQIIRGSQTSSKAYEGDESDFEK